VGRTGLRPCFRKNLVKTVFGLMISIRRERVCGEAGWEATTEILVKGHRVSETRARERIASLRNMPAPQKQCPVIVAHGNKYSRMVQNSGREGRIGRMRFFM